MIAVRYIEKFRNKNNIIIGYRLQDNQGLTKDVTPDQLKIAIRNKQIDLINLTLTSDNRLINKKVNNQSKISDEEQYIKNLLTRAKLVGASVKEIPTECNHQCILVSTSDTSHILYIPNNVTRLNRHTYHLTFTDHIKYLQGKIKVFGAKNLQDVKYMFKDCKAQSLDLSSFNTSKITDMSYMFESCNVPSLDLSSFDTSHVINMSEMFYDCKAQSLDLSSFNTSKVTNMELMFRCCKAQSIDLSSFNTSQVINMSFMFEWCKAQSLDLSSFNTSKVKDMSYMFCDCKAQSIDLSSFNTSKVNDMRNMFYGCKAQSLNLSSFNTSKVTDMRNIFRFCEAKIKATDKRLLKAYKDK